MNLKSLIWRSASLVFAAGAVHGAGAQGSTASGVPSGEQVLFEWSGRVAREVDIVVRGSEVTYNSAQGEYLRQRLTMRSALPRQNGTVTVQTLEGSGTVTVVQQPASQNDFTAVIRIVDTRAGTNSYRISARWSPSATSDGSDTGRDGVGRDRAGRDGAGRDDPRNDPCYDGRGGGLARGRTGGDWSRGPNGNGVGRGRGRGHQPANVCQDVRNGNGRSGGSWSSGRYDDEPSGGASSAGSGALQWSGFVDGSVELRVQGQRVTTVRLNGDEPRSVRYDFTGQALPRRNALVRLEQISGRGSIRVTQQPAAANSYTAVIRIDDSAGGMGRYDVRALW